MRTIHVTPLFDSVGLGKMERKIILTDRMEPPEKNPFNDWLHYGISALKELSHEIRVEAAACIGTGQGNDAIAVSQIFTPKILYATDIVEELLDVAEKNIRSNTKGQKLTMVHGRDCSPLPELVNLIFCNPPPLMKQCTFIDEGIVRSTIIEEEYYQKYSKGSPLKKKWSTLPLQGLLTTAKEKLTSHGRIVICYSGRIPFAATESAFTDAGFELKVRSQFLKLQTDPQFLAYYATYEKCHLGGDTFYFYDPQKITEFAVPSIIHGFNDSSLKKKLEDARISAQEAYDFHLFSKEVCHVGYVLEGKIR